MDTLRLYDFLPSGNGYKIRLLLAKLGVPFERIEIDITKGETRTAEFLSKNPNRKVPLLEISTDKYLAESNAILIYLSEGTEFLPYERFARAQVFQWLFFEQYSHEPYIATPRYWIAILNQGSCYEQEIIQRREKGYQALDVMEGHLQSREFFVNNRYSIADIALFAYTHVAHEAGYDLNPYPAIRNWIERIQNQPNHIDITVD